MLKFIKIIFIIIIYILEFKQIQRIKYLKICSVFFNINIFLHMMNFLLQQNISWYLYRLKHCIDKLNVFSNCSIKYKQVLNLSVISNWNTI